MYIYIRLKGGHQSSTTVGDPNPTSPFSPPGDACLDPNEPAELVGGDRYALKAFVPFSPPHEGCSVHAGHPASGSAPVAPPSSGETRRKDVPEVLITNPRGSPREYHSRGVPVGLATQCLASLVRL